MNCKLFPCPTNQERAGASTIVRGDCKGGSNDGALDIDEESRASITAPVCAERHGRHFECKTLQQKTHFGSSTTHTGSSVGSLGTKTWLIAHIALKRCTLCASQVGLVYVPFNDLAPEDEEPRPHGHGKKHHRHYGSSKHSENDGGVEAPAANMVASDYEIKEDDGDDDDSTVWPRRGYGWLEPVPTL